MNRFSCLRSLDVIETFNELAYAIRFFLVKMVRKVFAFFAFKVFFLSVRP